MKACILNSIRLLCLILLVIIVGHHRQAFSQTTVYGYAYLTLSSKGDSAEIHWVSPDNLQVEKRPFPLPEGFGFSPRFRSVVSPDGQWIASTLFALDQSRLVIHLFNVVSHQSDVIAEGFMDTYGENMAWSSDGRYLAINLRQVNEQNIDLYVYDTHNERIFNLSRDLSDQRDIAWSDDDKYLVTLNRPCLPSESCSNHLAVWDVQHSRNINSIDLGELPFLGNSACNPKLSPDNQRISFISNCGAGVPFSYDFPNEIYIGDIENAELTQITDYAQGQNGVGFQANYKHVWIDEYTLLIGSNYRQGENPEQQQVTIHDLIENTASVLSINMGADFELNTVQDQAVFLSRPVFSDEPDSVNVIRLSLSDLTSIEEGSVESLTHSITDACESRFIPSSTITAITASVGDCALSIDRITFVTLDNSTSEVYRVETDAPYVMSLGWILMPAPAP